ncbi:MAG TPA: hypothetical protein PKL85_03255 [Bacteroidia bacterium]|nr:hypothetical protein [Bacteroidia bacterium]
MKRVIFSLGIVILFSSCNRIVMIAAGTHNPEKPRHLGKLKNCLEDLGSRTDNVVFPKDTTAYMKTLSKYLKRLPFLDAYLQDGRRIVIDDSTKCSNPNADFTKSICSGKYFAIDEKRTLQEDLKNYISVPMVSSEKPYTSEQFSPVPFDSTYDYTVIVYWAYWGGRLNKMYTAPWEKNLLSQTACKVRVIKVAMDFTYEVPNYY